MAAGSVQKRNNRYTARGQAKNLFSQARKNQNSMQPTVKVEIEDEAYDEYDEEEMEVDF
jgi:hypothetical protein